MRISTRITLSQLRAINPTLVLYEDNDTDGPFNNHATEINVLVIYLRSVLKKDLLSYNEVDDIYNKQVIFHLNDNTSIDLLINETEGKNNLEVQNLLMKYLNCCSMHPNTTNTSNDPSITVKKLMDALNNINYDITLAFNNSYKQGELSYNFCKKVLNSFFAFIKSLFLEYLFCACYQKREQNPEDGVLDISLCDDSFHS